MGWLDDLRDFLAKTALGIALTVGGGGIIYLSDTLPKDYKTYGKIAGTGCIVYGLYKIYKGLKPEETVTMDRFVIAQA